MPIRPRKKRRQNVKIDDSIEQFFLTGDCERDSSGWSLKVSRFFGGGEIGAAWEAHKEYLLKKWKSEGLSESWKTGPFDDSTK